MVVGYFFPFLQIEENGIRYSRSPSERMWPRGAYFNLKKHLLKFAELGQLKGCFFP
jgi:hypothetical protein